MKFPGWVLVLTGCGRIAFDATSDGGGSADAAPRVCANPVNHDEDADLVDDACDVCPHLPDTSQPDGDGDGVGDACDPNPTTAGDSIAAFESFANGLPAAWTAGASADVVPDGLFKDGRSVNLYIRSDINVVHDFFEIGLDLGAGALPLTAERQFLISLEDGPTAAEYCEIEGNGTNVGLKYTNTLDSVAYTVVQRQGVQSPCENGSLRLSLQLDASNTITCSTTWPPTGTVSGAALALSPNRVVLLGKGAEVTLRYVIHIHSP